MMESPSSFETSVLTRATHRNIPEDGILHIHCRETLKSSRNSQLATILGNSSPAEATQTPDNDGQSGETQKNSGTEVCHIIIVIGGATNLA
jgi:hypothetical protein